MATKDERETKETSETGVRVLPIEEWAEGIANRRPRLQVIQHLLPSKRGEYIAIAGRTGIGKTNLALHLAFCLATGTPFFGLECQRIRVAFLEFEGDEANIKERYDKLKRNFPATEGRLFFRMMPLSDPKAMLKEIMVAAEAEACRILIVDPVKYLVLGDYLKPNDAAIFIRRFREELFLHRMAATITLPIRKPNDNSLIHPGDVYQMKGATEYADSATSVLLLEKKPHSRRSSDEEITKVTLYFAKQRIAAKELKPIDLAFNRNRCMFTAEDE